MKILKFWNLFLILACTDAQKAATSLVACASKRCIDKTTPPDTVTEIVPVYSNYGIRCCVDLAIPGFVAAKDHCPDLWVSSKDKKMVNMYN